MTEWDGVEQGNMGQDGMECDRKSMAGWDKIWDRMKQAMIGWGNGAGYNHSRT